MTDQEYPMSLPCKAQVVLPLQCALGHYPFGLWSAEQFAAFGWTLAESTLYSLSCYFYQQPHHQCLSCLISNAVHFGSRPVSLIILIQVKLHFICAQTFLFLQNWETHLGVSIKVYKSYTCFLKGVFDSIKGYEVLFLDHKNNSAIIHFSCLLLSLRPF